MTEYDRKWKAYGFTNGFTVPSAPDDFEELVGSAHLNLSATFTGRSRTGNDRECVPDLEALGEVRTWVGFPAYYWVTLPGPAAEKVIWRDRWRMDGTKGPQDIDDRTWLRLTSDDTTVLLVLEEWSD